MRVAGRYSFNDGAKVIDKNFRSQLREIEKAIKSVEAEDHRTKVSKERTMAGELLYSPKSLNKTFKACMALMGWSNCRLNCEYSAEFYEKDYTHRVSSEGAFRDMDFVKDELGVELQFGKYSFMVYNVAAKMTIFRKRGLIRAGVEIVPVKRFASNMSSGVSYFEQFVWDLEERGKADIDTPVLILGIDAD